MSIDPLFNRSVEIVHNLSKHAFAVSYESKLELYGLYKSATAGSVTAAKPGVFDMLGRAKWTAWKKFSELTTEEAKQAYCEQLASILQDYKSNSVAAGYLEELTRLGAAIDSRPDSSEDDNLMDLPANPSSLQRSTSLVAKARAKRQQQAAGQTGSDSEDGDYGHMSKASLPPAGTGSSAPAIAMDPEIEKQWVARQQAISRASSAATALPLPSQNIARPSSQQHPSRPSFSSRPSSTRNTVPIEQTLQNIHASLLALHQRISSLEKATQTNTLHPSSSDSLSHPTPSKEGASNYLTRFMQRLIYYVLLMLRLRSPAAKNAQAEPVWSMVSSLWGFSRDVAIVGLATLVYKSWRSKKSIREIWRSWRSFIFSRQATKIGT